MIFISLGLSLKIEAKLQILISASFLLSSTWSSRGKSRLAILFVSNLLIIVYV